MKRALRGLPPAVWTLGTVSLLSDAASDMIAPLLPVFITATLGGGAVALGWIEGSADLLSNLLKLLAGGWADRIGRYRPFVRAGYTLSSFAKPFVAVATSAWHVALVRSLDRAGKGLRTSPRDALLALTVPADRRGVAFGLHRAMDHAGAVVGPLIAIALLAFVTTDLRTIFWISAVPAALTLVFLFRRVEEHRAAGRAAGAGQPALGVGFGRPSRRMLGLMVPLGMFTLGNASDLFLLLKAAGSDASLVTLPALWLGLHVVKATSSVLGGLLTDRIGAARTISAGWIVYVLVYAALAVTDDRGAVIALCAVYGIYHGLSEGAEKALVAALARDGEQGASFGWYHLTIGVLALPASVMFGYLWDRFGSPAAFATGAALGLLALVTWQFTQRGLEDGRRAPHAA